MSAYAIRNAHVFVFAAKDFPSLLREIGAFAEDHGRKISPLSLVFHNEPGEAEAERGTFTYEVIPQ